MKPGLVLADKYRLVSLLGEGGMGAVWRAEDVRLGSAPVAIKLLHERDAHNPDLRARFEAEARIAAKLRSPHVVQLYDVGVDDQSGAPFLAMELLEGETLHDRLMRTGSLGASEVAHIVSHVARALSWAHSLGIVHRDLKPANIFLVQNADSALAKVLDFGVAKRTSQSLQQGRTATGVLLGTPLYMSPEQILSSKDVDHRADLWSLAVIAVQCLTGQLPFNADNLPGLALQICHGQATPPSHLGEVPAGFDEWFERGTRPNAQDRFSSAVQMADELRALCGPRNRSDEGAPAPVPSRAAPATTLLTPSVPYAPTASVAPLSRTSVERPLTGWRKPALRASFAAAAAAAALLVWLFTQREPLPAVQSAASLLARSEEQQDAPAETKPVDSAVRASEPEQKAPPLAPPPEVRRAVVTADQKPVIAPPTAGVEASKPQPVDDGRSTTKRRSTSGSSSSSRRTPREPLTTRPKPRESQPRPQPTTPKPLPSAAPPKPAPDAFRTF